MLDKKAIADYIARKGWCPRGIGTASGYIATVSDSIGLKGIAPALGAKPEEIAQAVRQGSNRFVFTGSDQNITNCKGTGSRIAPGRKFLDDKDAAAAIAPKPGCILEFDCVATSKNRDRDGDELNPAGARIDPNLPLLWQHLPVNPIGKMFSVLEQSDQRIRLHCGIADTQLGRDAATLVEFGALRISQGFEPITAEEIRDEMYETVGYRIDEWEMMEVSLVSIPANVDAVITQDQRGKLHHPIVKSWAGSLYAERKKIVGVPDITPLIRGKTVSGKTTISTATGTKAKKDDTVKPAPRSDGDNDSGEDQSVLLGGVVTKLEEMMDDDNLPAVKRSRLSVCHTILKATQDEMAQLSEEIKQASDTFDVSKLRQCMAKMDGLYTRAVKEAQDEMGRVGSGDDTADIAGMMSKLAGTISKDGDPDSGDSDSLEDDNTTGSATPAKTGTKKKIVVNPVPAMPKKKAGEVSEEFVDYCRSFSGKTRLKAMTILGEAQSGKLSEKQATEKLDLIASGIQPSGKKSTADLSSDGEEGVSVRAMKELYDAHLQAVTANPKCMTQANNLLASYVEGKSGLFYQDVFSKLRELATKKSKAPAGKKSDDVVSDYIEGNFPFGDPRRNMAFDIWDQYTSGMMGEDQAIARLEALSEKGNKEGAPDPNASVEGLDEEGDGFADATIDIGISTDDSDSVDGAGSDTSASPETPPEQEDDQAVAIGAKSATDQQDPPGEDYSEGDGADHYMDDYEFDPGYNEEDVNELAGKNVKEFFNEHAGTKPELADIDSYIGENFPDGHPSAGHANMIYQNAYNGVITVDEAKRQLGDIDSDHVNTEESPENKDFGDDQDVDGNNDDQDANKVNAKSDDMDDDDSDIDVG